jgi:hypothetical protein
MISLEFSRNSAGAPPSTTFVGPDDEIVITVRTDPPIEGIRVTGQIRCPDGASESLGFTDASAIFKLSRHGRQEGQYRVEATATKAQYRPTQLSASFYYQAHEPDVPQLDFPV